MDYDLGRYESLFDQHSKVRERSERVNKLPFV